MVGFVLKAILTQLMSVLGNIDLLLMFYREDPESKIKEIWINCLQVAIAMQWAAPKKRNTPSCFPCCPPRGY